MGKGASTKNRAMGIWGNRRMKRSLLLCVALTLAGCASSKLDIRSHVDPAADFSRYRSYAFVAEAWRTADDELQPYVRESREAMMRLRAVP